MKIELKKVNDKVVGYELVAETKEDKLRLGTIRNMHFWGFDETKIVYDGVEDERVEGEGEYAVKLHFIQKGHKK